MRFRPPRERRARPEPIRRGAPAADCGRHRGTPAARNGPRTCRPRIAVTPATAAGPPGIEDKQKIQGWDASELRSREGSIIVCMIRRHYAMGSEQAARRLGIFAMASRLKGFTMMLKDSKLNLPQGETLEATLKVGATPFTAFSAQMLGQDEIGIFPEHGAALAQTVEKGNVLAFKSKKTEDNYEFSISPGVIGWLRACSHRNGFAFEPIGQ